MWIFAIVQKQPPLINWNFLFRKYVFDVLNWATSKIVVRLIHILSSLCTSFLCKCHWSHFCAVLWQPHSTHYYNQWWFNLWNHSIFLEYSSIWFFFLWHVVNSQNLLWTFSKYLVYTSRNKVESRPKTLRWAKYSFILLTKWI